MKIIKVLLLVLQISHVIAFSVDKLAPIVDNLIKKRADSIVESKEIIYY